LYLIDPGSGVNVCFNPYILKQVSNWKKQLLAGIRIILDDRGAL